MSTALQKLSPLLHVCYYWLKTSEQKAIHCNRVEECTYLHASAIRVHILIAYSLLSVKMHQNGLLACKFDNVFVGMTDLLLLHITRPMNVYCHGIFTTLQKQIRYVILIINMVTSDVLLTACLVTVTVHLMVFLRSNYCFVRYLFHVRLTQHFLLWYVTWKWHTMITPYWSCIWLLSTMRLLQLVQVGHH